VWRAIAGRGLGIFLVAVAMTAAEGLELIFSLLLAGLMVGVFGALVT